MAALRLRQCGAQDERKVEVHTGSVIESQEFSLKPLQV